MKVSLVLFFLIVGEGYSQKKQQKARRPAFTGGAIAEDEPLEIHGQTRNLNMLLKLQSEREEIDFIKLRKNYEKEIKNINY